MDGFISCSACHRLIARDEKACPFCETKAARCSGALAAVLGTALALTGCSGRTVDDPAESSTQVGGDGASAGSEGGSGDSESASDSADASGGFPPTSDASDSSSSSSSTTDDTSMTASFYAGGIDTTDTGGNGCGEECDIWNPDACPEGEKCTAVGCQVGGSTWDTNVCRDVQGDAQPGDECEFTDGDKYSGEDTCAKGSLCWNLEGSGDFGVCVAFCQGSPEATTCVQGTTCVISHSGTLPICFPSCDPLAQNCEEPSEACYPTEDGPGYFCVYDASGNSGPYGTVCNYVNSCNAGLACIEPEGVPETQCNSEAAGCCSPMCSIAAGEACPGTGQTCEPFFDPQPPGYEDVGVCRLVP